jgi:recombination protein RecA
MAQGRDNARQYLIDNPEIAEEVEEKIRDHFETSDEESEGTNAEKTATLALDDVDELLGLD